MASSGHYRIEHLAEHLQSRAGAAETMKRILRDIAEPIGAFGAQLVHIQRLQRGELLEHWFCDDLKLVRHAERCNQDWMNKHPYFEQPEAFDARPGALLAFGEVLGDAYYESAYYDTLHRQSGYANSAAYGFLLPSLPHGPAFALALCFHGRHRTKQQMQGLQTLSQMAPDLARLFGALHMRERFAALNQVNTIPTNGSPDRLAVLRHGKLIASTEEARELLDWDLPAKALKAPYEDLRLKTKRALALGGGTFDWTTPRGLNVRIAALSSFRNPDEAILRLRLPESAFQYDAAAFSRGIAKGLSAAEARVTSLVAQGLSDEEIVAHSALSPAVVRDNLRHIQSQWGVNSRDGLIATLRA